MIGYIYTWTNTTTGKVYVGQTRNIRRRLKAYRSQYRSYNFDGNGTHKLFLSIRKHGWDVFRFDVIFSVIDADQHLNDMEKLFIIEYDSFKNGYNCTTGGEGAYGYKRSAESIKKGLESSYTNGIHFNAGRKHNEELKQHFSEQRKGEKNAMFGRNHSDGTRQKISQSMSGEKHQNFGKPLSAATKASLSKAVGIPIIIDGVTYVSMKQAIKCTGLSRYKIRRRLETGEILFDTSSKSAEEIRMRRINTLGAQISIDGVVYKSRKEIISKLGLKDRRITYLIHTGKAFYIDKETGEPIPYTPKKPI